MRSIRAAVPLVLVLGAGVLSAAPGPRRRARRQGRNPVPADPEAEGAATPGPDSAIAVLAMDGTVVQSVSGLFDTNGGGE